MRREENLPIIRLYEPSITEYITKEHNKQVDCGKCTEAAGFAEKQNYKKN